MSEIAVREGLPAAAPQAGGLIGHSGAVITLHRSVTGMVVRKTAGLPAQNLRLSRQREKQQRFAQAGVDTPPVLGWGEQDGLAFFEMDYVPAGSVAARLCGGDAADSGRVARFAAAWIAARRREADGLLAADALSAKLDGVLLASAANQHMGASAARLADVARRLRRLRFPSLPRSPCHGDFTTENMLAAADGRVVLIDFDETGLDSYWLDVAKLYQDLLGLWCLRHVEGAGFRRAAAAVHRLRQEVDALLQPTLGEMLPDLPALVCLNLMRAFPYSRSEADCRFILDRVEAALALCRTPSPKRGTETAR